MKSSTEIIKTVATQIKKILWFLGLRAFALILIFIVADIIISTFVFYQYVFLAEQEQPQAAQSVIKFDVKTYQKVLDELQSRAQGNTTAVQP